jgi:hypothetical protein
VVFRLRGPIRIWMVRRSVPDSSRCVAKLWRLCLWVHSRHYLPFLTMSSDMAGSWRSFNNAGRNASRVDQSPDIVFSVFSSLVYRLLRNPSSWSPG